MFLHFARLFSYIACLTHVLVLGQDLAVVRPYASLSEVSSLESSFLSWDTFLPCNATLNVPVDLILVYSQAFDDNADAWNAASRVQESFQLGERPWHRCFRSVTISAANLTAAEDIYDSRGYAVRKDWVNGPNKVFRFILRSFVENEYAVNYTAFYFMEIDAVPVRSYWLEQYALEALCYPSAAIRGSRYLGDSWDMFGTVMPDDLLLHINGNAIYYIHHPWLRWLNSRLMDEATTEYNEVAFDVRMARLTLDARQGTTTELGEAWNQSVESGDEPYQHDSSLVGNFGNTLLNTSFEHGVYIKHGSLSNIFDNLENLTLVVATYNNTIEKFLETVSLYHPFRTIMVLHFDAHSGSNETIETPSGTTSIVHVEAAKPRHLALCELASMVTTPYFVFTDSSHLIASPAHVLATSSGHPVLPYINAGSTFCTARADCVSSLAQAEDLFGVKLNYHHDTFETVFITNVTQQFCVDWELASSELGSFEECAFVHGPTADDYIAWQISMDEALLYVPKEKERVGWRPWTISWTPHDPDERNCSVYTQAEQELHRQSISECGLIVESPETCKATSGCSWRPIFYSGKCIISPRISFPWQEEVQERPTTCEALQSTTTTTTASRSSTGTSTSTSASETTDTTTVTVTRSSTDTSTSQSATGTSTTTLTGTSTRIPGSCIQPSVADADTSSCTGKFAGDTCEVSCASGFLGQSTIYTCTVEETFSGTPPTCVPTTTVTTSSISTSQTTHTLTSTITATNTATSISHTSTATRSSTTATSSVTQTSHTLTSTVTTSNTATSISHTSTATRSSTTASSSATQTTHILTSTISTTNTVTSISHTSTATRSSTTATSSVTQTSHTLTSTITTSNTATSISHTSTATRSSTTASSSATQTTHTMTVTVTRSSTDTSTSQSATGTSTTTLTGTSTRIPGSCIQPSVADADTSSCTGKFAGDTCEVSCASGFLGQSTIYTCTVEETFSGTPPTCVPTTTVTTSSISTSQTTHTLTSTITATNTATSISHTSTATRSSTTATSSVTQTSHTLTSTITTSNTATSISHTSTATRSSTTATSSLTQTSHTLTSTITTSNTATSISHTSTATSSITSTETTHTLTSTITTTSTVTSVSLTQTATSSSISATSSSTQTTHTVTRTMSTSKTVTSISHTVTSTTSQSTSQTTNTETSTISSSTSQTSHTQTSTSSATATVTGTSHTITSTTSQSTSQTTHTDTSTISTTETVTSISQTITSTTTRSTSQTTVTGTATRTSISATTATGTTSRVPGSCPVPIVDGADTQACDGKFPGETCEVSCSSGFLGQSSILTCSAQEVFTGTYPTCVPTTTMTTMTTTSTQLVACSDGLPTGVGTNVNDCYGKLNGQTCTVSCMVSYTGDSAEYYCNPSTASFEGPPVTCSKITCSADQLPSGYDVSGCTGLVARDFCFVSCERGFVSASEQYVCGVDGIFSGTPPTCQRATCPSDLLPAAPGVNVSACVGAFTGSSCDIACSFGFQGTSSSYTCSLDAVFEGTLPTCERKTCLVPADYMNSSFSHDCDGVQHGGSCTVSCAEGYGGSQIVQLCTDGILDGSLPTCTPIICSFRGLNIPLGIDVTPCVGILSGQSCTVSCMRGYSLVGTPTLECTTSGVFGKILASCEPQPCGNLTDVLPFAGTHIGESCNGVYTGQVCTAFCKEGYTISGNATVLICGDAPASSQGYTEFVPGTEESWAAEQSTGPTCNVNTCSEGIPDNPMLSHNCTNVQTGGFCIVDAVVPYQLEGGQTVQLICEASGYLTGNIPNIVPAVCPYASLGDGTGSTCHYTPYGADCWAYCLQGDGVARQYRCMLNGQALELQSVVQDIQCNSTGRRLSGSLNPCPSASVTQVGLEHLQFLHDCTDKLHDEACIAHCGFGFDMQEAEPSLFVCKDSTLVGSGLPTCVGKPCNFSFPSGLGVSHNCNAKTTGETCEASCGKPGYTYAASATLQTFTCMATQVFEGTAPSCEPITCSDLELGERFYHNCQSKRFGETCGVSCATGYHLQGWGEQMVCSADGTFSGTTPTCSGNPCSNPLLVDATLDSNECTGLTTAETCTVRCAAGFTPNSTTMQCDPTGLLLGVAPSCSPMVCDTPIELSAVSIAHTCSSLTFNRSCAVTCAAGYKLSSLQQEWACSWNASSASVSLLGSLPSCEPEVCTSGVPTESERTVTNCTDVRTGETCQQQCADGYIGSDGTFTCGSDGAARTDATVRCQPVTCNLSVPEARTASLGHICSNIPFGFSCSAFCQKGYTSTNGVQSLTCAGPELGIDPASELETADAITLRGSLPSCLPQACFYNFPTGSQFLHTCDGIRTGGQCTASCSSEWEGDSTTLTCEPEGALSGNFPVCTLRTVTQTRTTSLTSTWTVTTTLTDFEVRVNVAGVLRMDVNNSVEFVQDPDAKGVVGQVLSNLIGVGIEELQLSMVLTTETLGRLLAVGGVTAVYSVWFLADTQQQADDLGSNITAQLDAASVFTLQQLIVDGMMNVSEAKVGFYSIQVLAHNADILVGTRRQEAVSKLVTGADGTICSPSSFPVITGAGPFDCQEPQVVGQQCRAPCDSGVEAVVTCDEQGWQLQDECPPESYLLVVIFASAGALCCLITVCVVLCACRGDAKTHPEEDRQETPDLPPPLPSIHELPQPENFDTSYYNWAEQWEQSRQSQGTDIPLVAPAGLPAATNAERSSAAIPTPPQRPPPVNMQRAVSSPPPLPSMARRDGSTDQQLVVQVEETEHVVLTRPHFLRKTAQMQDDAAIEELTTVEEPITLHVQRINGTPLAKITSDGKETVAELINSIKEVAGSSLNITLTTDIKVLRPEQTLQENGLYDGSVVTAIRHPELFVAAAFDDGTAAVWSVESGKCERNFECRYGAVKSCTLAQSGLVLVLGMVDGTVQLWNVVTGKFMRQFSGHMGPIFSVASSPNGKLLATGCFDGTSKLLNMETGRVVRVCSGHRGSIKSLCFSVDSRTLATGSEDCSLKLWKVLDRHGELTLLGHTSTVTAISFSHHGKALASGAENGEVNAWSAVSGRLVWELPQASSAVKSLAFSRDGVSLAVGSFDGEITFFSASTRTRTSRVQCSTTSPTRCMGFSPAAHLMIVGTEAGELRVYGSDDGASRKALEACAIPSMASSVASVAVCGGPVPKKPKGARRRSDLAIDSDSAAEAH